LPIMVMSPEKDSYHDMINYRLEPEIYSFRVLKEFAAALDAVAYPGAYPVHIKIDTGMKRLGFEQGQVEELAQALTNMTQVQVKSVFSHLVASDNKNMDAFSLQQMEIFEAFTSKLEQRLGYGFIKHICNSGGITRFKQAHYNMVRLGIGMYGFGVNEEENHQLEPISILKTRISQIKQVKAGETVGYNRHGKVLTDSRIATIPIGYADGFHRSLGNGRAGVYIQGNYCKTIGNVCMDMTMVDVSGTHAEEGDEVIVFSNADQVNQLALAMNSIPYEVLTNISSRVKRIYIQD
jgi:Alr-MurF fusion protein